jgi:hypothetical protein
MEQSRKEYRRVSPEKRRGVVPVLEWPAKNRLEWAGVERDVHNCIKGDQGGARHRRGK